MARYAVRKLDTEDDWWFVVDLTVRGAAILAPDAVVDRFISYEAAHTYANLLNGKPLAPDPGLPAGRTATAGTERVTVVPIVGDGVIHGALSESVGDYAYLPRREN